jgi:ribosome assembly protein YihI (activator of Der GTPase)
MGKKSTIRKKRKKHEGEEEGRGVDGGRERERERERTNHKIPQSQSVFMIPCLCYGTREYR